MVISLLRDKEAVAVRFMDIEKYDIGYKHGYIHKSLNILNSLRPSDAYMRYKPRSTLVQIMACCLAGAKPLSEPMLE